MKVAIIVLAGLCLLPNIMAWVSGYFRRQQLGIIDNKSPRQQYTQLIGPGARAVAAQQNSWEALGLYSAALLAVGISGVEIIYLAETALAVLVCRILYSFCYLFNLDIFRSLLFSLGLLPLLYWFYMAITGS